MQLFSRRRRIYMAPHTPQLAPRRIRFLRAMLYGEYLLVFIGWVLSIIGQLLLGCVLLFRGILPRLLLAAIHQHLSLAGSIYLFALCGFALILLYANFVIHSAASDFFDFHAYFRFYRVSRYIEPERIKQARISQVIFRHREYFDFGFSGSTLVIFVKKRLTSQSQLEVKAENIVESSNVTQVPEDTSVLEPLKKGVSGEIYLSSTQELKREVSHTEREHQEQLLSLNDTPQVELDAQSEEKRDVEVSQIIVHKKCRLLISVGQTVWFALESEPKNQSVEIPMNSDSTAILTYLALHQGEDGVKSKKLKQAIYGNDSVRETGLFNQHVSRIRERIINRAVSETFVTVTPAKKILKVKENPFDPFQQDFKGRNDSRWRLSTFCHIKGISLLTNFYRIIKAGEQISREDWRKGVRQLRELYSGRYLDKHANEEEYSGGYLIEYLQEDAFARWAPTFFQNCREKYIYVLATIAEYEVKIDTLEPGGGRGKRAAELYKECAYAATCEPIHPALGERSLRKCIEMYMHDENRDAAQQFCEVYGKRVKKIMLEWEPEKETKKVLQKHMLVAD